MNIASVIYSITHLYPWQFHHKYSTEHVIPRHAFKHSELVETAIFTLNEN